MQMSHQPGRLAAHQCLFHHTEFLWSTWTYSESSRPGSHNHINFGSLCLSSVENSPFTCKVEKKWSKILLPDSSTRELRVNFLCVLNDNSSSQDRLREAKLVCLELSGHKDSEYVKQYFLACLLKKRQCKMSGDIILCSQGPYQMNGGNVAYIQPQVLRIATLLQKWWIPHSPPSK